jgi:acyl-CoA thioester hydrolase
MDSIEATARSNTQPHALAFEHVITFRVRYSETDQMGTFYNSRALEWFECGRTEFLRSLGVPYAEMEARGVLLPLTEAHLEFLGRARYDDLLAMTTRAAMAGRARLRFDHEVAHPDGAGVVRGWTVHAFAGPSGSPIRPPAWFLEALGGARAEDDGGSDGTDG